LFLDCTNSITCWENFNLWHLLQLLMTDVKCFFDVLKLIWRWLNTTICRFCYKIVEHMVQTKSSTLCEQIELVEQMLEYAQSVPHSWQQVCNYGSMTHNTTRPQQVTATSSGRFRKMQSWHSCFYDGTKRWYGSMPSRQQQQQQFYLTHDNT
jgi:hypothetical protein